jgi:hypothetical protein
MKLFFKKNPLPNEPIYANFLTGEGSFFLMKTHGVCHNTHDSNIACLCPANA